METWRREQRRRRKRPWKWFGVVGVLRRRSRTTNSRGPDRPRPRTTPSPSTVTIHTQLLAYPLVLSSMLCSSAFFPCFFREEMHYFLCSFSASQNTKIRVALFHQDSEIHRYPTSFLFRRGHAAEAATWLGASFCCGRAG